METGSKREILGEEDDQSYEYLRNLREAVKLNYTSMEMLVIESKWRILDNIIHKTARDALEKCPLKIKRSRTKPMEMKKEHQNIRKEPEDVICDNYFVR